MARYGLDSWPWSICISTVVTVVFPSSVSLQVSTNHDLEARCEAVPPQTMWPEDAFTISISLYIYINMISFGEAPPCSSEWLAFSNWCFQKFLISSPKILTGFPIWFPLKIRYPLEIHRWMMILPDRNGMGEIGIQLVPLQVIAGKLEDEMIPCLELCKDQSFSAKSSIFLRPLILSNHTSLCWTTWIYIYMLYI